MSRCEGQKTKLLVLLDIFVRQTDQEHPLGVPKLVELLKTHGVTAERKSVYDDIEALRAAGYDIELRRGRGGGYYMEGDCFELPELKLLVDAVQASKFITQRKSRRLIEKLERFTSRYHAEELKRQVLVSGRYKSPEESIYYWVDELHRAISGGWQITFVYRDWSMKKQMTARRGGQTYQVSPWALVWENGNYYLIATQNAQLRHYRVDKMAQVTLLRGQPRQDAEVYAGFNVTRYVQQMFGMFGGPLCTVRLRCQNRFVGAMLDRFGTAPTLIPVDEEHFDMNVSVQVSPQFYGWVCGFGGGVQIMDPPEVRGELKKTLQALTAAHADPTAAEIE